MKFSLYYACLTNLLMGIIEIVSGALLWSSALLADSADFISDGINYGSSIWALNKSEKVHKRLASIKGVFMILAGLTTLGFVVYNLMTGHIPLGEKLSILGGVALFVNISCAVLLSKFRGESADLRAVWLCTRNDAIGNILVIIAGFITLYWASPIPDAIAGGIIGTLAILGGHSILFPSSTTKKDSCCSH